MLQRLGAAANANYNLNAQVLNEEYNSETVALHLIVYHFKRDIYENENAYLLITVDDAVEPSALNVPPHILSMQPGTVLPAFLAHGMTSQSLVHCVSKPAATEVCP